MQPVRTRTKPRDRVLAAVIIIGFLAICTIAAWFTPPLRNDIPYLGYWAEGQEGPRE